MKDVLRAGFHSYIHNERLNYEVAARGGRAKVCLAAWFALLPGFASLTRLHRDYICLNKQTLLDHLVNST